MTKVSLSLSVKESHLKNISKVAAAARKLGMQVDQRLDGIGMLTGSVDADKLEQLGRIAGVAHVEPNRECKIAPPCSPIQ